MARGRKPLAAEVKKATGAYKKNPQRENKAAPKADGKAPEAPRWFNKRERDKWCELVADLSHNGVLSSDAREILIAYCTAYSHWMEARESVKKTGLALRVVDKNGQEVIARNAFVSEMNKFREQMNKLLPELGLTPASRQKLTSIRLDEQEESPLAQIMARMGRG